MGFPYDPLEAGIFHIRKIKLINIFTILENSVAVLTNTLNCDSTDESEEDGPIPNYSPESGHHWTSSFDRFPFMSR